jgi:hypothetical protein
VGGGEGEGGGRRIGGERGRRGRGKLSFDLKGDILGGGGGIDIDAYEMMY